MSWCGVARSGVPLEPSGGRGTGPRRLASLSVAWRLIPMTHRRRRLETWRNGKGGREDDPTHNTYYMHEPRLAPMHSSSLARPPPHDSESAGPSACASFQASEQLPWTAILRPRLSSK